MKFGTEIILLCSLLSTESDGEVDELFKSLIIELQNFGIVQQIVLVRSAKLSISASEWKRRLKKVFRLRGKLILTNSSVVYFAVGGRR